MQLDQILHTAHCRAPPECARFCGDARSIVQSLFQVLEKNKCKARPGQRLHIVLQSLPVIFIAITVAKTWRKDRRCANSKQTSSHRDTHAYRETGVAANSLH